MGQGSSWAVTQTPRQVVGDVGKGEEQEQEQEQRQQQQEQRQQ